MVTMPNTELGEAFKILSLHSYNFSDFLKKTILSLKGKCFYDIQAVSVVLRFNSHNRTC